MSNTKSQTPLQNVVPNMQKKGMNTYEIVSTLYRTLYQIPENVSSKTIAGINKLDMITAQKNQALSEPINITRTSDAAQATIDELGKSRSTQPLQQSFATSFAGLKSETVERTHDREALEREMNIFIEKLRKRTIEVVDRILKGTSTSDADIKARFADLIKEQKELITRMNKLFINEHSLQIKLDQMVFDTMRAVAVGRTGPAPSTFTP